MRDYDFHQIAGTGGGFPRPSLLLLRETAHVFHQFSTGSPCPSAMMNVRTAQTAYDQIAWREGAGVTQEAADLWEATTNYEQAQAEYQEVQEGATADEIADARAQVALAQAELDALLEAPDADEVAAAEAQVTQAQAELDALLACASANDLEAAQLNVDQAQLDLASGQRSLAETQFLVPFSTPQKVRPLFSESPSNLHIFVLS